MMMNRVRSSGFISRKNRQKRPVRVQGPGFIVVYGSKKVGSNDELCTPKWIREIVDLAMNDNPWRAKFDGGERGVRSQHLTFGVSSKAAARFKISAAAVSFCLVSHSKGRQKLSPIVTRSGSHRFVR